LLCCLLAAIFASPLLLWPVARRPACCGPRAAPLLVGLALAAGLGLFCLIVFTAPGLSAFHHICSVAGWAQRAN
jgi:hypothetical protein